MNLDLDSCNDIARGKTLRHRKCCLQGSLTEEEKGSANRRFPESHC
jgi:hypothetical protein